MNRSLAGRPLAPYRAVTNLTDVGRRFGASVIASCFCLSLATIGDVACVRHEGWSPAAPSRDVTLTVRVRGRGNELPIHGALVQYNGTRSLTDESGELLATVAAGAETVVDVSAAGFESMTAAGTLSDNERWTFYLVSRAQSP